MGWWMYQADEFMTTSCSSEVGGHIGHLPHLLPHFGSRCYLGSRCCRESAASGVARERIRFSPIGDEPVGWIIENVGPDLLVFASSYPHPEGTGDPIAKFEATMGSYDAATIDAFYIDAMAHFMVLSAQLAAHDHPPETS
jgi:hypothetical protein